MKIVLVVLDGWGHNDKKIKKDAINDSDCKTIKKLIKQYPSFLINASGTSVGLPDGTMGNSEVGHLTLGAGRIVKQNISAINESFQNGDILDKLKNIISMQKDVLHLIGMISDGGIHSHIDHLKKLLDLLHNHFKIIFIHCISDGRDTEPKKVLFYLDQISNLYENCKILSIAGRFYAMDRDNNEERTDKYFNCLTKKEDKNNYKNVTEYIKKQYEEGKNDENIEPAIFCDKYIQPDEMILFFNFRADRMRQITKKFAENKNLVFTITEYDKNLPVNVLFKQNIVKNTLSDVLETNNIEQVHIAETEKYAHVTYFFNGNRELIHKNERRIIVDSVKTDSFAKFPKMSTKEISDKIIDEIEKETPFIVANFAASDMVGHTGDYLAARKAVEFIDCQIQRIYDKCQEKNFCLIITADHGNAEVMVDEVGNINKKHTTNKVPFIICNELNSSKDNNYEYVDNNFGLQDVAPTILHLMNIEKPESMTGRSVLE